MSDRMDKQLRTHLLERLSHRAARLAAVSSVTHPGSSIDAVIALMARHVTETAMVLLGETFTRSVMETLFDNLSESHGICRFCHARPLRDDKTMCQVCWDTATSDDEISDEEIATAASEDNES